MSAALSYRSIEPTRCVKCGYCDGTRWTVCKRCSTSMSDWPDNNTAYARLKQSDAERSAA